MFKHTCQLCTSKAEGKEVLCPGCLQRQAAIRQSIDDMNEQLAKQPAVAEKNDREWYGHFTYEPVRLP